mgnify:CR=1 FL=1
MSNLGIKEPIENYTIKIDINNILKERISKLKLLIDLLYKYKQIYYHYQINICINERWNTFVIKKMM